MKDKIEIIHTTVDVRVTCGSCGKKFIVTRHKAGRQNTVGFSGKCDGCKAKVNVKTATSSKK